MRLDKFVADINFGTRKTAKKVIKSGRVKIDDVVIKDPSFVFDENKSKVYIDDEYFEYLPFIYILLNKPIDYMSSTIDERYPSILNLIDPIYAKRVRIVGRLDADTTGTILLTDDGKLNNRLTNPNWEVSKVYEVTLNHEIPSTLPGEAIKGVDIGKGEIAKPLDVTIVSPTVARVTLTEGKYHEIKRLFDHFDLDVVKLDRLSFGPLSYEGLNKGEWRLLNVDEIAKLYALTNMESEDK